MKNEWRNTFVFETNFLIRYSSSSGLDVSKYMTAASCSKGHGKFTSSCCDPILGSVMR